MTCCACELKVPLAHGAWARVMVDDGRPALACHCQGLEPSHGDPVVVETADGEFLGRVTLFAPPVFRPPLHVMARVTRRATEADLTQAAAMADQERVIGAYLRRRTRELGLELRPCRVRLPLVGRKVIVSFTAEQRVDFRPLVRELAKRFRRRVEMRAEGVRDGARELGAIGPCGRATCCASFMERFHSVTVRMAKRQNLSLNPTKISGMCGRLMCCLAHEVDQYPGKPSRR